MPRKITTALKASVSAAKPAKAATAAKPVPAPATAKPATPAVAKPAKAASAEITARAKLIGENRGLCSKFYSGASSVIHSKRPGKLTDYAARVQSPIQKIGSGDIGGNSERDDSLLAALAHNAKAGSFDPVSLACDLGAISRAASVKAIAYDTKAGFSLTAIGAQRAKLVQSRFTK